jgi:hypothetical protein
MALLAAALMASLLGWLLSPPAAFLSSCATLEVVQLQLPVVSTVSVPLLSLLHIALSEASHRDLDPATHCVAF